MKKRVLSLGIVLTMMASSMQTFAEDYSDMPTGWSNAAMTYAVNNGYIQGSNGKLNPQGLATRAQVASIFARVLKLENKADLSGYDLHKRGFTCKEQGIGYSFSAGLSCNTKNCRLFGKASPALRISRNRTLFLPKYFS